MNEAIFYFLYGFAHRNGFLDSLIVFLANDFPYVVMIAAGLFLLFHHEIFKAESPFQDFLQKKKEILMAFFAGAVAWVTAHILKIILQTGRPEGVLVGIESLFEKTGEAFPSGHAAFFAALAASIFFTHRKAGLVFMLFALLIGTARVASGVHFPV